MIFDNESTAAAVAAAAAQKTMIEAGDVAGPAVVVADDEDAARAAADPGSPEKSPSDVNDDNVSPKTNARQTDVWRPYWYRPIDRRHSSSLRRKTIRQ